MSTTSRWRNLIAAACLIGCAPLARSQVTESPLTVPPGSFLIEMDALSVELDRAAPGGGELDGVVVAHTILTTGITDRIDLQVGADLFLSQRVTRRGLRDRRTGIGDVFVRGKWTFMRDDESGAAAALLPFVKLPTGTGEVGDEKVSGGVIVPWMSRLPGGGQMFAQARVDVRENAGGDGYETFWFGSLALERPVTDSFKLYGELLGGKPTGGDPLDARFGGGGVFELSRLLQLDVAVYRGISSGAADWNPVVRLNWRF